MNLSIMTARASLAIAIGIASASAAAQAELKFDRFKNRTEVSAGKAQSLDRITPTFLTVFDGEMPTKRPATVMVLYTTSAKEWQFLRCHSVDYLADSKPVAVANVKHSGNVGRGYVIEQIVAELTWDAARQIAEAQTVESRICRTEIPFDHFDTEDLRAVMSAATPKR